MAAFQAARDCWRLPQAIGWVPMAWAEEARAFGAQIPPRQEQRHAGTFGLGMIEAANAPDCPAREADVRVPGDMLEPGDALENLPKSRVLNLLAFSRQKFMHHLDPQMRFSQDPKAAENAALVSWGNRV